MVRAFGPLVHLNNVSGGVVAGDRLALHVEVMPGAAGLLTTTGATRLYRHREGAEDSEQTVSFAVGDAGLLEYLPDVVIPYAGSRHVQRTAVRLGLSAAYFGWDVMAPGRMAAGERFAFERLRVQTEISAGGRPIVREDYSLEPARMNLAAVPRMAEFSHTASFCAIQQGRPPSFWRELESRLNGLAQQRERPGHSVWGASMLASDGVVVRGLSMSGCYIQETLVEFWKAARLAVTGVAVDPPRKIY